MVNHSVSYSRSWRVSTRYNWLELIEKYHRRTHTQCLFKNISNSCLASTNIFTQNIRSLYCEKFHRELILNSTSKSCFSIPCTSIKQNSSWNLYLHFLIYKPKFIRPLYHASDHLFSLLKSNYFWKIIFYTTWFLF